MLGSSDRRLLDPEHGEKSEGVVVRARGEYVRSPRAQGEKDNKCSIFLLWGSP
jgi:hypothetical protein